MRWFLRLRARRRPPDPVEELQSVYWSTFGDVRPLLRGADDDELNAAA